MNGLTTGLSKAGRRELVWTINPSGRTRSPFPADTLDTSARPVSARGRLAVSGAFPCGLGEKGLFRGWRCGGGAYLDFSDVGRTASCRGIAGRGWRRERLRRGGRLPEGGPLRWRGGHRGTALCPPHLTAKGVNGSRVYVKAGRCAYASGTKPRTEEGAQILCPPPARTVLSSHIDCTYGILEGGTEGAQNFVPPPHFVPPRRAPLCPPACPLRAPPRGWRPGPKLRGQPFRAVPLGDAIRSAYGSFLAVPAIPALVRDYPLHLDQAQKVLVER